MPALRAVLPPSRLLAKQAEYPSSHLHHTFKFKQPSESAMGQARALIYLLRRDLRLSDNVVFSSAASEPGISHFIPLYVFNPSNHELSGLASHPGENQTYPFPEARSRIGRFWRCGPHRVKFLAESLHDLQTSLKAAGSGWKRPPPPRRQVGHRHLGTRGRPRSQRNRRRWRLAISGLRNGGSSGGTCHPARGGAAQ